MENALKEAINTYATLSFMSVDEVLDAIKNGNDAVTESVKMLMFSVA